jgi:hypothetical protein
MVRGSFTVAVAVAVLAVSIPAFAQTPNPAAEELVARTLYARTPGPSTIVGTLTEVHGRRIVLETPDGEETIHVRGNAQIYMGSEPLTVEQMAGQLGARVTAAYEDVVGMKMTSSVILHEADTPQPDGGQ